MINSSLDAFDIKTMGRSMNLERNPSPDAFDKKPMSRSMNPPVPTNRWSVSPTNTSTSIPPLLRLVFYLLFYCKIFLYYIF